MANLLRSVIVFLTLFSTRATAAHFRGGTVSWRYLGPSGNASNIEINFRFGWRRHRSRCTYASIRDQFSEYSSGSWNHNGLLTYNSRNETKAIMCTAYDTSSADWGFGYNSFVATVTTSGPFHISYTGGDWTADIFTSDPSWALTAGNIDLGVRSDTGIVNNPPTALSSPVVRLAQGCAQVVAIAHRDIDNDNVTCRYAISGKTPDECSQACNGPSSKGYSHFTLDEAACTIHYDGGGATTLVIVSLVLSDHPKSNIVLNGSRYVTTSDFLSEIPLQFVMKIEPASGSCNEIPTYPKESILNGDEIFISAYGMMNRTLFAYSSSASITITQFVVLGPMGLFVGSVQSLGNTLYSADINWHPGINGIGAHDVCYYATDSAGRVGRTVCFSFVVSSDAPCAINNGGCSDICNMSGLYTTCSCFLPCWILDIDEVTCIPNMSISCVRENMTLALAECAANGTVVVGDSLNEISQKRCQSTQMDNQHILNIEASTCGIRYEANPFQIQFAGNMWIWHGVNPQTSMITRGEYQIVPVRCTISLTREVSANFVPELPFNNESFPVDVDVEGFGAYTFFFEFYKTVEFTLVVSPNEYPMSVTVNDRFYFSIGVIGQPGFLFSTRECEATTAAADPTQPPLSYTFLRDGCFQDATLIRIPSGNPMQERFSMKAFDFGQKITSSRDTADISLQCKVMLCDSRNLTSRCHQECIPPARKKRSASEQFDLDDDDDDDHDDDDENPMPLRSGYSESPLQNVRGRFILVADPESFDGLLSSSGNPHHLYYVLIAIGLTLIAIALFVSYRMLQSRRILTPAVSAHDPGQGYKSGNVVGNPTETQISMHSN